MTQGEHWREEEEEKQNLNMKQGVHEVHARPQLPALGRPSYEISISREEREGRFSMKDDDRHDGTTPRHDDRHDPTTPFAASMKWLQERPGKLAGRQGERHGERSIGDDC